MPADLPSSPVTTVSPALRALLDEILDYAGLFPPAALPLDAAMRNYTRHRTEAERWMLGRFVVPATRLPELSGHTDGFDPAAPLRLAVLGTGGNDTDAFLAALEADLRHVSAFLARHDRLATADVLEVRLPPALRSADPARLTAFFDALAARTQTVLPRLDVFFEVPLTADLPVWLPGLADTVAAYAEPERLRLGLKMRTGGLEATAFPPGESVATFIATCCDRGVRFKATAGLHHPVRRYHASVQARMHGFLNVFGAAVLAHAHGLDTDGIAAILLDEDAASFRFTDERFAWKDLSAGTDAVREARRSFAVSFGSCSFDEPREDLRALGLL